MVRQIRSVAIFYFKYILIIWPFPIDCCLLVLLFILVPIHHILLSIASQSNHFQFVNCRSLAILRIIKQFRASIE